jgi:extracellular factor (EF) 3-hydroxypalmitic acid methyl ester biosynthesis protein
MPGPKHSIELTSIEPGMLCSKVKFIKTKFNIMVATQQLTKKALFKGLQQLVNKGTLERSEFPILKFYEDEIGRMIQSGELTEEDILRLRNSFTEDYLQNSIHGRFLRKPLGYAGDFLMIDSIYQQKISSNTTYASWDKYMYSSSASVAVRNRKSYFKRQVQQKLTEKGSLKLLNIASGPGRDLLEVYQEKNQNNYLSTLCVDMDANAIKYAKNLLQEFTSDVQFIHKNIYKFQTKEKFELVWSAGLFDYFNDRVFVAVLNKLRAFCKPGAEIIIGNFNQNNNPNRTFMEVFFDWHLHHRTEEELEKLAISAGFGDCNIRIGMEPENVNLFLHIHLPGNSSKNNVE